VINLNKKELSARERVRIILNHNEADRVPMDMSSRVTSINVNAYKKLTKYLMLKEDIEINVDEDVQMVTRIDERVRQKLGTDFVTIFPKSPYNYDPNRKDDGSYVDQWGVRIKLVGDYSQIYENPLKHASVSDLEQYSWPDPEDEGRFAGLKEEAKTIYEEMNYVLIGLIDGLGSIFERAWKLRGMQNFFIDLISNPKFAGKLMDKILDFNLRFADRFLDEVGDYVDIIQIGDDFGGKSSLLISPELYAKTIMPRQKELIDFIKSKADVKIFYHTCGSIMPLIDKLLGVGIDILNPIQVSADNMDTKELKRRFNKELVFWGAIDSQYILPQGSMREVEDEVKRRIEDLAEDGGYVLAAVHNIQSDVPPSNIVTMFEAGKRFGRY
jgi:uroporphyrinogen decarboxylase